MPIYSKFYSRSSNSCYILPQNCIRSDLGRHNIPTWGNMAPDPPSSEYFVCFITCCLHLSMPTAGADPGFCEGGFEGGS